MESQKITEEQLKSALCEVRKAHRLIYEYQRRMQDLTWFIKNKLGFPDYDGYKKFTDPLKSGKDFMNKINVDNWSWDWIYTYVYEYFLGEQKKENSKWLLSIIQISDTGYYKREDAEQTKITSFAPTIESESKLIFYLSVVTKDIKNDYCWNPDKIIEQYVNEVSPIIIKNSPCVQIVYPISLSKFINEKATMKILQDFVKYCNENAPTNLIIQGQE